jgi:hypothetical protein
VSVPIPRPHPPLSPSPVLYWTAAAGVAEELYGGLPLLTAATAATAPAVASVFAAHPVAAPIVAGIVQGAVIGGNPSIWPVLAGRIIRYVLGH